MLVLIFKRTMSVNKTTKIKAQEWIVLYDGRIKCSEKELVILHDNGNKIIANK